MRCTRWSRAHGGGRSSGELGVGVREHSRGCGWVLWSPGGVLSTTVCSVAALGNGGYGGDMAGGEELSAPTDSIATRCKRGRGERGKIPVLTVNSQSRLVGSGMAW